MQQTEQKPAAPAAQSPAKIDLSKMPAANLRPAHFTGLKDRFTKLLNEESFIREVSFAVQLVQRSSQLQKCNAQDIIQELANVAQLGLSLNPIKKEAYLVTRYDKTRGQYPVLEPGYQGLVKLITETGAVRAIYAHPVNEGDIFEVSLGTGVEIIHKPQFKTRKPVQFYAVAILENGEKVIEVMTLEEIYDIRSRSEGYKAFKAGRISSTPWESDFSEMARKTVIRRIFKYLPKGQNEEKFERVAEAVAIDENDFRPSIQKVEFAKSLVNSSAIRDEISDLQIERMNNAELDQIIERAQLEQLDPLTHGGGNISPGMAAKGAGEAGKG